MTTKSAFVIIKLKMPPLVNTTVKGVPRFLTTTFDAHQKDITEKAVALYIRDNDLTPRQFAMKNFKIKLLLPYLQLLDRQWGNIAYDEMKTTPPRTLVQYMNTHIARWKTKYEAVQKVIDALPESHDHSADVQVGDRKSLTLSDNISQNDEEVKVEETPWGDQESMIMNDQTMITEKKVA